MRAFAISALVASALATQTNSDSITLTQFQQIAGFPAICTNAYNTPIAGCTRRDFTGGNACSQACADGILKETVLLNSACAGISTSPNTLIGLFFQQQGVAALCPKVTPGVQTTIRPTSVAPTTSLTPSTTTITTSLAPSSSSSTSTTSTSLSTLTSTSTSATSSLSTESSSTSPSTVESSTSITFTTSSSAIATPFDSFNLNGPQAGDSSHLKTNLLAITLPMAGLAIGFLI